MLDRPQRRNPRLDSFDYTSNEAYFITICTYRRYPYFNDPILRSILEKYWNMLSERFVGLTLDAFGIMPNHVHFIVGLGPKQGDASPSLGNVVGALKSLTAVEWLRHLKAIGNRQSGKIWQDRYYDHIISNKYDLYIKRKYIENNPIVAQLKKENQFFP
jgi:putative transposase